MSVVGSVEFDAIRLLKAEPDRSWRTVIRISLSDFLVTKTARDATELIKQKLSEVLTSVFAEGEWILSIPPIGQGGFAIDLSKSGERIRCLFGELEREFEIVSEAMVWVERALSHAYQLRIISSGGRPIEWRLEPISASTALTCDCLAMGYVSPLSWFRAKSTVTRRNALHSEISLLSTL
jgi:hypothetical protein